MRIHVATEAGVHEIGERPERVLDRVPVALAAGGSGAFALTADGLVWDLTDGPRELATVDDDAPLQSLAWTPGGLLVGTTGPHLWRVRDGDVERLAGLEDAPGHDTWYQPGAMGRPPDARSMAADPDGALYVNVHVGGVLRSDDDGAGWAPTAFEVDFDIHQVVAPRRGLVLAAAAVGLCVSEDGGRTCRVETDGLHAAYSRAVALAGDTVLVTSSTGPRTSKAMVYRRPLDTGAPFERCGGLPEWFDDNLDTGLLRAHGETVVLGTPDGRLLRSDDAGAHFAEVAGGLGPVTDVALVP